jgi:hypothetical protein
MRHLKITLAAAAIAVGSSLSIASSANATIAGTGVSAAVDRLNAVEQVQYFYGGRRHCFYPEGWHGPGWYWCGYHRRHGLGWGGEEGYRGWRHR